MFSSLTFIFSLILLLIWEREKTWTKVIPNLWLRLTRGRMVSRNILPTIFRVSVSR